MRFKLGDYARVTKPFSLWGDSKYLNKIGKVIDLKIVNERVTTVRLRFETGPSSRINDSCRWFIYARVSPLSPLESLAIQSDE